MKRNRCTWKSRRQYQDGTGFIFFETTCPQYLHADSCFPDHLYTLCYSPTEGKTWFWDSLYNESDSIRLTCTSFTSANQFRAMLARDERTIKT
jgi:hypothetical protein